MKRRPLDYTRWLVRSPTAKAVQKTVSTKRAKFQMTVFSQNRETRYGSFQLLTKKSSSKQQTTKPAQINFMHVLRDYHVAAKVTVLTMIRLDLCKQCLNVHMALVKVSKHCRSTRDIKWIKDWSAAQPLSVIETEAGDAPFHPQHVEELQLSPFQTLHHLTFLKQTKAAHSSTIS